jgi:hypothetical protein
VLELDGKPASDDDLMAWLGGAPGVLVLRYRERLVPVERIARDSVPAQFHFQRAPAPASM